MQPHPRYHVLVPFFSSPAYLRQTLQSVIGQSDPEWVATVVDDSAGGDDAKQVVDELADSRIGYLRNAVNLGVARNFNRCFEVALDSGSELATILHADDLLEVDYVKRMKQVHALHPSAACVAPGVMVIDENGKPSRTIPDTVKNWLRPRYVDSLKGERGLERLFRGQFFYCPSVSYRPGLLRQPAWNARWQQVMDLELYSRVLLDGGEIRLEASQLFRYRRHEHSLTHVNSTSLVRSQEETELCRELVAEATDVGWKAAARSGRWRITVRLQAMMRAMILVLRGRFKLAVRAFGLAVGR